MQFQLEKSLFSWDFSYSNNKSLSTEEFVDIFNQHINFSLLNSLSIKRSQSNKQTSILWDSLLFKLHCIEKRSYLASSILPILINYILEIYGNNQKEILEKL